MFMDINPDDAYWFQADQIRVIEQNYQARYLGHWAVKKQDGTWTDYPVDVFYCATPDKTSGHGNYFGMFLHKNKPIITDATSAFSESMIGLVLRSGEVLVSRFRHDCRIKDFVMIDGGRDYLRTSGNAEQVLVSVSQGEFQFHEIHDYAA